MKKFLFSALLLVSIVTVSFAKNPKLVNNKVLNAFSTEFASATDVDWSVNSQFVQASFNLDGKKINAFYSFNGDMIGTSHTATLDLLPQRVQNTIAKKYAGYTIGEIMHFENSDEKAYYISAENDHKTLVLKVLNNHVSVFKKKNK